MQTELTSDSFSGCLNESFSLQLPEGEACEFKLIEVKSLNAHRPPKSSTVVRTEPFSLLFVGPRSPIFDQQVFRFEHQHLGVIEIFLVPVGEVDDGIEYEAVFT